MAYAEPAQWYLVVTIIVVVEESQGGEDILVHIFSALGVKDNLSLLGWIWAISDEERSSETILIN